MSGETQEQRRDPVAECTLEAVHRRDHHHAADEICHPHTIEVVHLGRRAVVVCHDCHTDSGFLPERDAARVASAHHDETFPDESRAVFSEAA
jgi:hypothetical protein